MYLGLILVAVAATIVAIPTAQAAENGCANSVDTYAVPCSYLNAPDCDDLAIIYAPQGIGQQYWTGYLQYVCCSEATVAQARPAGICLLASPIQAHQGRPNGKVRLAAATRRPSPGITPTHLRRPPKPIYVINCKGQYGLYYTTSL